MSEELAQFVETMGRACLDFAETLRTRGGAGELTVEALADPIEELNLGARQRQIVEIVRLAGADGLKTAEIAVQMGGYDTSNAHMALRALQTRRVIEEVPGAAPLRWRLAQQYRATADPYIAMAGHVGRGEWTTYGDVSIAVRGDTQAARAVGRAAATLEHFPNPHRILRAGGVIPDEWHTTDSSVPNPEVCRQRLESEGVRFDEEGRAGQEHYVPWYVLLERSEQELAA